VSERQVQVWLQNKRQRTKARRLREEAASLTAQEPESETSTVTETKELEPLEGCWREDMKMEVFIEPHQPFQVMWASRDWLDFCGFEPTELKKQTMRIIQGPQTDGTEARELNVAGIERRTGHATLINYTKNRIPFRHTIEIEPLANSYGQLRMFRARSSNMEVLEREEADEAETQDDYSSEEEIDPFA